MHDVGVEALSVVHLEGLDDASIHGLELSAAEVTLILFDIFCLIGPPHILQIDVIGDATLSHRTIADGMYSVLTDRAALLGAVSLQEILSGDIAC